MQFLVEEALYFRAQIEDAQQRSPLVPGLEGVGGEPEDPALAEAQGRAADWLRGG